MALNAPVTDIDPYEVIRSVDWPPPKEFTRIEGGWDTIIWRFVDDDGVPHGLRLYRETLDRRDPHAAFLREALAFETLRKAGITCPQAEAQGIFRGQPFFIMTWLPGQNLLTFLEKQPWKLWALGRKFGQLQARLHSIEVPEELNFNSDDEWIDQADDSAIQAAMKRLDKRYGFCHFDFHPINVMSDGKDLTGILDFSFSGRADIRADLGRTQALLVAAPIPPSPKKPILQYLRGQFHKQWQRGYREVAGSMPLEPLFSAWGASTFLVNITDAVNDGRGWGTPKDIETMRRYVEDRKRAAGLT
jgi:aminoglycoside phosphotransferase (APT) family kinase protein